MAQGDDAFLRRLEATFRLEADEHLAAMSSALSMLEKNPAPEQRAELVERMFRGAHSLKGAARAVNRRNVERLCHGLEDVFAALKGERIAVTPALWDTLDEGLAVLSEILTRDAGAVAPASWEALLSRLDAAARVSVVLPHAAPPVAAPGRPVEMSVAVELREVPQENAGDPAPPAMLATEMVRLPTARLDRAMRQAEELLGPRLAARQHVAALHAAGAALDAWQRERTKAVPALRSAACSGIATAGTGALVGLLEYLERDAELAKSLAAQLTVLRRSAARDQRILSGLTEDLLQQLRDMQLLPVAALLEGFPRSARALARELSKQVEVSTEDNGIEVDRRVLDEIRDPLLHIVRNCVAHGIEPPAERAQCGKPVHGRISITVSQELGDKITIAVTDDGAGIDSAALVAAARKAGALTGHETPGEAQALALVFRSGVTTSPIVTDVAGRGLGLAIAREKVERLGGAVSIESQRGTGTTFRIVLPRSSATYRGVLVRVARRMFAVPIASVERVTRVRQDEIWMAENRATIALGDSPVALVRLDAVLELTRSSNGDDTPTHVHAVVLAAGATRVAFQVDAVLSEEELLVRPLGPQLVRVRNVAGASVLGSGEVVPVLSVADLLRSAAGAPIAAAARPVESARQKSILVAEDSITSRALIKNILESAGYRVVTAVDGADAYATLRSDEFDLLVSDIEMPRMDGFELTEKVRADTCLAALPVVLVTSLGSREHRERGVEVGASAYIVKSSFEQSNLLEVVRRLL